MRHKDTCMTIRACLSLGFRVQGLGIRDESLDVGFRITDFGFNMD